MVRQFMLMAVAFVVATCQAAEPVRIPLWVGQASGTPSRAEDEPELFLTQPVADVATRAAVIVCPGGGYRHLSMDKEGSRIAEWLNSFGVTAFVLRYRHDE